MKRGKLYAEYFVGGDAKPLVRALQSKNIPFYDCKIQKDGVILSIDVKDGKKFFAISRNMCYNVKRIRYKGIFSPIFYAAEKIGLIIGFAVFTALAFFFDGIVSEIDYLGDGAGLKREIDAALAAENVKTGAFFTADAGDLAKKIYSSSEKFAFVTVRKSGRRLIVEAYRKKEAAKPLNTLKDEVVSDESGTVVYINCMSGTPRVSVGDKVVKGDVLVDGNYEKDGKAHKTYALAEIELECEYRYLYESAGEGEYYEARAKAAAIVSLGKENVLSATAEKTEEDGKTVYNVTVTYSVIIS